MSAEPALFDVHAEGRTSVFAAGRALALHWFVPALTDPKLHLENDVVAKERPRGRAMPGGPGGKAFVQFYTPEKTKAWEAHVAEESLARLRSVHLPGDQDFTLPIEDCRVLMTMRYNLRKPASYPKSVVHHTRKPDVDNTEKAILDAIVQAGILHDDAMITDVYHYKRYATPDRPPGIEIDLTAIAL